MLSDEVTKLTVKVVYLTVMLSIPITMPNTYIWITSKLFLLNCQLFGIYDHNQFSPTSYLPPNACNQNWRVLYRNAMWLFSYDSDNSTEVRKKEMIHTFFWILPKETNGSKKKNSLKTSVINKIVVVLLIGIHPNLLNTWHISCFSLLSTHTQMHVHTHAHRHTDKHTHTHTLHSV